MDARHPGAVRWSVPEPHAVAEVRMGDGTRIFLRRHGNANGPRLVISHGNGFAADAYYPFWSLLTDRFDVVLHDLRNHGWNPVGELRSHDVWSFSEDVACVWRAIDTHFGAKPKIGVYHSVSALGAFNKLTEGNGLAALVMFDPMICPPGCNPMHLASLQKALRRMSRSARGRRDRFPAPDVLAESYGRAWGLGTPTPAWGLGTPTPALRLGIRWGLGTPTPPWD